MFSAAIYRLTVSTDSSLSVAEIRCLSDHQDQIRSLINVNGQSDRKQSQSVASSSSDIQLPSRKWRQTVNTFSANHCRICVTLQLQLRNTAGVSSCSQNIMWRKFIQIQIKFLTDLVTEDQNYIFIFINIVSEELHEPIFQIFTWFYKVLSSESRQQTFIVLFHLNLQRQIPPLSYLSQ